ncbi:mediator of RNA polymerase II transcription subunit 1-domain-containing protein [Biscogniauxia mediterranea]|nr:mediator of RNA polymerase II transcription subunit 1-domain-containing protein [Biscogniauxia mediterranea]
MSTPMRHGPSQQGRTPSQHPPAAPTPQASTPFSNSQAAVGFSPHGPRSSPQQFKKSPATAASATMMGHSSSAPVNFDSPSAAAALGALGLNELNLDNISMGGLVTNGGRTDEEDRRKRLDAVVEALWNKDSGRVSDKGLERLALHFGLERLWEPGPSGAETDRTLIIAGQTIALEIGINNHVVYSATLSFNEPIPSLDKHVDKASAILLKDLALAPNQSPLTKKLTQFKANFERLAIHEKLSVPPGLNCFEAVAGMWESLDKLHRWDVEKLRADPELAAKPEHTLRVFALCTQHGCPLMHTRGRIGLSLDYWKERRKMASTTVDNEDLRTWAILIECAAPSSMVYSPVRVSDKWIGPNTEKTDLTDEEMISVTGPLLDWLEPPNTLLPASEEVKTEEGLEPNASLSSPKPPYVTFMATFDPPVVVTHGVSMDIYKISASNPPLSNVTFDALLFPIQDESTYDPSEPRELTYTQTVPNFANIKQGQQDPVLKAHKNTLFIDKPVYGQLLTQVPFAHPKELISMLPVLRQYAFLSLLLDNSFKPRGTPTAPEADIENKKSPGIRTVRDEFSVFMSEANTNRDNTPSNVLKMDVVLTAHPVPRLQLVFPFKSFTANINLEIQLGGKVHVVSDNIFPTTEEVAKANEEAKATGKGKQYDAKQWARMLEMTEDLGIWVEYIKHKME